MSITKIKPGHYRSPKGEVRNVSSASGAPHTRSARAQWLVTLTTGRSFFVASLAIARQYYL